MLATEIAVLVLACGGLCLVWYMVKVNDKVRVLNEKVKVLDRELSNAFWKKILQREEEKKSGQRVDREATEVH